MRKKKTWIKVGVLSIILLGFAYRWFSIQVLPIDYDEDDYLAAAQRYAHAIKAHDFNSVINYSYNFEHPPLSKLLYGAAITLIPDAPLIPETTSTLPPAKSLPVLQFQFARMVSAGLGTLQVIALALFNPLAGLFLAIESWHVKYTSQIMLEPLPSFMSLLAVLFYLRSKKSGIIWVFLSAFALGITAASKFTYCIAGVAIAIDWLSTSYPTTSGRDPKGILKWMAPVILWGTLSILVFFAVNPRMWSEPFLRLKETILYHGSYAESAHVKEAGLPFWQPLVWLLNPATFNGNPSLIPTDAIIAILAIFGLRRMGPRNSVFTWWLVIGIGFLMIWPTKWPQYILTISVPLCVAASRGFSEFLWNPAKELFSRLGKVEKSESGPVGRSRFWKDSKRALFWLIPGILLLGILAIYPILFQFAMSLTDFSVYSIIDGIRGGVWRAAWQGLTGLERSIPVEVFGRTPIQNQVHYSGFSLLLQLFLGAGAAPLVFDLLWTICVVSLQTILGVSLALILSQKWVKFRGFWSILFILPWAIPEFVSALIWLRLLAPNYGWLSQIGRLPADVSMPVWYSSPDSAFLVALIAGTWMGFPMVFLATLGGLKMVPPDVYDAASIDGASWSQTLRNVTYPLVLPLLLPIILIRIIFSFNQFYLFYVLGFPFPITTLSNIAFQFFSPLSGFGGKFAVAAAINIFSLFILIFLLIWFNRINKISGEAAYA